METPTTEPLLTPSEVAAQLKMPVATLTAWRARKTGPRFFRVGRHVRYSRADVQAYLDARSQEPAP